MQQDRSKAHFPSDKTPYGNSRLGFVPNSYQKYRGPSGGAARLDVPHTIMCSVSVVLSCALCTVCSRGPDSAADFLDGFVTALSNSETECSQSVTIHQYHANRDMRRVFWDAVGE